MKHGEWRVRAMYGSATPQDALDAGFNYFGAQLLAESMENKTEEVQVAGFCVVTHDHHGKRWYVSLTTTPPEIVEDGQEEAE